MVEKTIYNTNSLQYIQSQGRQNRKVVPIIVYEMDFSKRKNVADNHLDNLIVRHLAGSQAYGTNTPTSDTDYRDIFMADKEFILTLFFTVNEVSDTKEKVILIFGDSNENAD